MSNLDLQNMVFIQLHFKQRNLLIQTLAVTKGQTTTSAKLMTGVSGLYLLEMHVCVGLNDVKSYCSLTIDLRLTLCIPPLNPQTTTEETKMLRYVRIYYMLYLLMSGRLVSFWIEMSHE